MGRAFTPLELQAVGPSFHGQTRRGRRLRTDGLSGDDKWFRVITLFLAVKAENSNSVSSARCELVQNELSFWSTPKQYEAIARVEF